MDWLKEYRRDVGRYQALRRNDSLFKIFVTEQGLWALFQYRVASGIYRNRWPWYVKQPLLIAMVLWQKLVEMTTGIYLPYAATIGSGLYIGHFGNIMVHAKAVLGEDCNIHQGVTIGETGQGERWGVPRIGDRVYIAPNATVLGKISLGNDTLVGPNSLVLRDVPEHVTVLGVPARVVDSSGSEGYIVLENPTIKTTRSLTSTDLEPSAADSSGAVAR